MQPRKKTLAFRSITDTMLVLRENKDTPRDEDWDAFLEVLSKNRPNFDKFKILVMTEGGGPNQDQRKRLEVALGGRPVRVAVVTDSVKVRFIVSSIALLNREIRTYSNREIEEAYQHLNMTELERRKVDDAIREMNQIVEF